MSSANNTVTPAMDDNEMEIQMSVAQAKEEVALRDAVRRLSKNPDFDLVYNEHFLRRFATEQLLARNSVTVMSDPVLSEKNQRALDGFGIFQDFLHMLVVHGNTAEASLQQYYAAEGEEADEDEVIE